MNYLQLADEAIKSSRPFGPILSIVGVEKVALAYIAVWLTHQDSSTKAESVLSTALQAIGYVQRYFNVDVELIEEGCTPADARMLRAANHQLAVELSEAQVKWQNVNSAFNLCPNERSHLERMRWIADYLNNTERKS